MALLRTNTGIGTTNPTSALHVIGDVLVTGVVTATTFNGQINSGIGTIVTFTSTNSTITNLNVTREVVGTSTITNLYASNGYINVGVVTDLTNTRLTSGIATITTLNSSVGTINNLTNNLLNVGIGSISTLYSTNAYINSGIITDISGTRLNYTGVGTITTLNSTNSTLLNINSTGISTIADIKAERVTATGIITANSFRPSSGYIQAADGTNSFYIYNGTGNVAFQGTIGVGQINNAGGYQVITFNNIDTRLTGNLDIAGVTTSSVFNGNIYSLGISTFTRLTAGVATITTLNTTNVVSTNSDFTNLNADRAYIDVGIVTDISGTRLNYTGVGTIATLNSTRATITDIQNTNINNTGIATIQNLNVLGNFDVYDATATFYNSVYIAGNLSIGGTATVITAQDLRVYDKDIILGIATDAFGNDISTDNSANHGGVALASTEGYPLVSLKATGINTLPDTYKQIMWLKGGTFGVGTTDAWLFNYAVGVGSTQVPNNVRLAVGQVQITDQQINAATAEFSRIKSGIATITGADISNLNSNNINSQSGIITDLSGTRLTYTGFGTITNLYSENGNINVGVITNLTNTRMTSGIATITNLNVTNSTFTNANVSNLFAVTGIVTTLTSTNATLTNINSTGISTLNILRTSTINSTGVVTAPTFVGDLLGVANYAHVAGVSTFSGYANASGVSTFSGYANNAGIATYAWTAGVSTYSGVSGFSTFSGYSNTSGFSTFSGYSNTSGFSTFSGYANNAGLSTYAITAGVATYAGVSGFSTFSGYANVSGFSTFSGYANNAGLSTYAWTAGVSTYAGVSGFSTFSGYANASGVSTFSGYSNTSGFSTFSGYANSSGVSTFSGYSNTSGFSTFSGYSNTSGFSTFSGYANASGVSTFSGYANNAGIATYAWTAGVSTYSGVAGFATFSSYADIAGVSTSVIGGIGSITQLNVSGISTFVGIVTNQSTIFGRQLSFSGISTLASLHAPRLTYNGSDYGNFSGYVPVANGAGGWSWASITSTFSVNNILNGFNVFDEGSVVGTAGSITTLDFRGNNITAIANLQPNGIATITVSDNPSFLSLTVTPGITTLGVATISSLLANQLNVSGLSTFIGIGTFQNDLYVGGNLYVQNDLVFDEFTARNINVTGLSTLGIASASQLYVAGVTTTGNLTVNSTSLFQGGIQANSIIFANGGVTGNLTGNVNSSISTITTLNSTNATITNINSSGIITASGGFVGNLTGTASIATYAKNAGLSTYAWTAGVSTYSGVSGFSTFSGYANSSGVSTFSGYANASGVSTFSGYANNAGLSTYAITAGVATYSGVSGFSTFSGYSNTSGFSTFSGYSNSSGVSTFSGYSNTSGFSTFSGYANNAGLSTYAITAGVSTYSGVSGFSTFSGYANASGVSTFSGYANNAGLSTYAITAGVATYSGLSGVSTSVIGGIASVTQLSVSGVSTFTSISVGGTTGTNQYVLTSTGTGLAWLSVTGTGAITGINIAPDSTNTASYIPFVKVSTGTTATEYTDTTLVYNSGTQRLGIGTTNPTSKLDVIGDARFTGVVTAASFSGNASSATQLQTARNFSITGNFVTAPSISFDGTGNVALAATITPDSIGLGTYTSGDYVKNIFGTSNQITVNGGTGEGSTPTLSIPNQFTVPQDLTVTRDLQVNRNLNVNGSITIGGTSATLFTTELKISDPDIVLGFRTDSNGNDISNDNTSNHGGVALASTEGTPLVQLYSVAIGETNPATYKKIMWFKSGSFAGLGTDAWLINYGVGIGSTQFPSGTRLAAGSVQFTERDLAVVRNINASGVITATTFSGNATSATYAVTAGVATYAGVAGFSTFSGYANNSGIATYAWTAGVSTYSGVAGVSTFSGYANNAGLSTYAITAGVATYSGVSGFSTFSGYSNTSGFSTFSGYSNISGFSTFSGYANNAGLSTYAITAGVSTYSGVSGFSTFSGYSNSSGVSTFSGYANNAGIATYTWTAGVSTYSGLAGVSTSVIGGIASVTQLNVSGVGTVGSLNIGSTQVISSGRQLQNILSLDATTVATIENAISSSPNDFTTLNVAGVSTFTNGPVLIGSGTSTGTLSQPLQVTGGAYVSGNLGVGTTNPQYKLDVLGNINFTGSLFQNGSRFTSGIGIGSTSVNPQSGVINQRVGTGFTDINIVGTGISVTGYGSTVVIDFGNIAAASGGALSISTVFAPRIQDVTFVGGATTSRIGISTQTNRFVYDTQTGSVGIGTSGSSIPSYKLDVIGDINSSTSVKIKGVDVLEEAVRLAIALG